MRLEGFDRPFLVRLLALADRQRVLFALREARVVCLRGGARLRDAPPVKRTAAARRAFLSRIARLVLLLLSGALAAAPAPLAERSERVRAVVEAAVAQVGVTIHYDPGYRRLRYPGGDLPADRGVCTDVLIRAFRAVGVDLQVLVHEDMTRAFSAYPQAWGLKGPDPNIDHRRVPNLMTLFRRKGKVLPVTARAEDYLPGDVVAWRLPSGVPHVGLIADRPSGAPGRMKVVHNIGAGAQLEDVLFAWPITGHARWF